MSFGRSKRRPLPGTPTVFDDFTVFDGDRFLEHVTVAVEGDRIVAVEPAATVGGPRDAVRIRARGRTLLPGFIDCHVHLGLVRSRRVARRGITTARDLGWPLADVQRLATRRRGPRLLYSGPVVTAPGGIPARAPWAPPGAVRDVDSPDEARAPVDELAAAGVCVVEVALDDRRPTLDDATLGAVVVAARAHGLAVTAFATSIEQLERALDAGVLESACGLPGGQELPDGTMARMIRAGVVIVSMLHLDPHPVRLANMERFVRGGGRVVYGTGMGEPPSRAGIDVEELRLMMGAGMTLDETLSAATAGAAAHLGRRDRGRLRPGLLADLVLVAGDPRQGLETLARPLLALRGGRPAR